LQRGIEVETFRAFVQICISPVAQAVAAAVVRVGQVECEFAVYGRAVNFCTAICDLAESAGEGCEKS